MSDPFGQQDYDLNVEVDLTGVSKSDLENFGKGVPPGMYHAVVEKVEKLMSKENKPHLRLHFKILDGTSKAARTLALTNDLFYHAEKTGMVLQRYSFFADRLGLPIVIGTNNVFDWRQAINKQCVIKVKADNYIDPKTQSPVTRSKVDFSGIWPVNHVEVSSVPKDKAMLEQIGLGHLYTPDMWIKAGETGNAAVGANGATGQAVLLSDNPFTNAM